MDRCIVCGKKLHKSRVPRIDKHPKIKKIQLDEDGDTYPVCLTDIHVCYIVCKYGKDWLNENGHSVIVDRFNQLNKQYDFFKEVNRRKN